MDNNDTDIASVENDSSRTTVLSEVKRRDTLEDMIAKFLHEKDIDEEFIGRLIADGLTDEIVSALHAMDFEESDIECLRSMWGELMASKASVPEVIVEPKAPESEYLREHFGHILPTAIREIILKKPADPIEYLAQWLLHFKVCEERDAKLKEFERELLVERAWLAQKDVSSIEEFPFTIPSGYARGEEEEYAGSVGNMSEISYLSYLKIGESESLNG